MTRKCVSKVCSDIKTGSDLQAMTNNQNLSTKLLFNMCILYHFVNVIHNHYAVGKASDDV